MSLILILEDNRPMAEAAAETLTAAGFEALTALSVAEAIIAVQERRPDLVLAEYLVAESTGLDFLEKLKHLDNPPPVIMATGLGEEDAMAHALALGAWSYVLKTENYLRELPALAGRFLAETGARKKERERERLLGRRSAQNELAGWLAHNFKNILAASLGYLNLINFKNPDQNQAKREEYLTESRQSQQTAIELLERLIRLTEAEAETETERFTVAEVLEEAWSTAGQAVLASAERQSPERLAQMENLLKKVVLMNAVRRLPPITFVRSDLTAVFLSLLQNSLEAVLNMDDPRILVAGEAQNQRLELTVRDNGRGMSAEVARQAREPLFSTKGEVGVGLGLSLADALVERHGGSLEIKSEPGAGATVRITLPL
ncbi:MAG: response regulator [Candidatus Adiutrix sp.]|jgi:signal transduction histidine kinase|nr:response regulator [Candidatus Adiutrix sp.]